MHNYLRAIGFSNFVNKSDIDDFFANNLTDANLVSTFVSSDMRMCGHYNIPVCQGAGVAVIAEKNKNRPMSVDFYYPYSIGYDYTLIQECTIQRHSDKDTYAGIIDDYRLSIALIFYLTNSNVYNSLIKSHKLNEIGIDKIFLSALSISGRIILPVANKKKKVNEYAKDLDKKINVSVDSHKNSFIDGSEYMIDADSANDVEDVDDIDDLDDDFDYDNDNYEYDDEDYTEDDIDEELEEDELDEESDEELDEEDEEYDENDENVEDDDIEDLDTEDISNNDKMISITKLKDNIDDFQDGVADKTISIGIGIKLSDDEKGEQERRLEKEDLFSIVDTSLIPYGIECDKYQIVAEILSVNLKTNEWTNENIYDMRVETMGLQFNIIINEKDLEGEPMPGRRFKGIIWLLGEVEFFSRGEEKK